MDCWSCHEATGLPTCAHCGVIQPLPPGGDHFAVLGLEPRYDLARTVVEERQREQSRLVHPDRFATASATERRHSLLWATAVNDAAKVLRDPVRRAEYLLKRRGLDVGAEAEGRQPVEPAFLMEIMELREELHAACTRGDDAQIAALGADMARRRAALLAAIEAGFATLGEGNDPDALRALGRQLTVMRYYDRFTGEIAAYEEAQFQEGAR
jgi:molecular chaperone HscB